MKSYHHKKQTEKGAALAMAIIVVAILAVVALTALTFSSTEARIAGSDLQRTQTFYATEAAMEKMTNDFSNLFRRKMNPTSADLLFISRDYPPALASEGFTFAQTLELDADRLDELRAIQGLPSNVYPRVNISDGPYAGLYSSIIPYKMTSIGKRTATRTEVKLEREFNNYLVPLFQFGMFSNEDIEVHPGPLMTFNGRIHANGNLYALRNTKFLNRITLAGEFVRDATRGGETNDSLGNDNVWIEVNGINVKSEIGKGSVKAGGGTVGGPNFSGSNPGERGYFPGSPNGVANPTWESESVKPPSSGTPNRFGGQLLTNTTGANALKLPLELAGNNAAELIKRALPSDGEILSSSRYHNKSQIRILLDGENDGSGATNVAGIDAGKGVQLASFTPSVLNGGENVLKNISNTGAVSGSAVLQRKPGTMGGGTQNAMTVRGVKSAGENVGGNYIPNGSGIRGRILIEIVKPDGTTVDVTQAILSLGITEGEPNGIVYLQRPLWAGFIQGSRDRTGGAFDLVSITRSSQLTSGGCMTIADGEINDPSALYAPNRGFIDTDLTAADEDGGSCVREVSPIGTYNMIVPINVYNVREGWVRSSLSEYDIYERGMTSVVEINMRNLARWLDGVYDANLLSGTEAVSANVKGDEGYVVYISDRRSDQKRAEYLSNGTSYASTNGIVDNEDIYGPNGRLDEGEDVIDFGWTSSGTSKEGTLQKDTRELPDSGTICCTPTTAAPVNDATRMNRAFAVMRWFNASNYFRRSVRLFDGETLSTTAAAGKLSPTKGITISSENMVYVWGNFNTTGITGIPTGGSTLNNGGFTGAQVPSSIVCDAFFPLSKTWFDGLSALYPEGSSDARNLTGEAYRMADDALPSTSQGTSVRAGVIAGTTISSMTATPGRDIAGLRRNGGIINYPRFLETWNLNGITNAWSYTGSFIPLYRSTQALSQWENDTAVIYMPPRRNWSFDETFLTPNKLPPGTPFFQYIQATGFRQNLR
jgi:PilX N-terminal